NSDKMYQNNSENAEIACDIMEDTETQLKQTTAKEKEKTSYEMTDNTKNDEIIIKDKTND
ncbi:MAG: hypothetical protein K2L47_00635, partial [Clostridia bacterium]|nr:hypothetical protein [Clostridia bacterium]